MSKVIGIVGTRSRNSQEDYELVESAFIKIYEEGDTICSGLCPEGGDRFAVILKEKYNTKFKWYPPYWDLYGKQAGFIRNTHIAKLSDILIACVVNESIYKNGNHVGETEDTIKKFISFNGKENLIII